MTLTTNYPRKTIARVAQEHWLRLRSMPRGTVIRVRIQTIDGRRRTLVLWRDFPGYWSMLPPRQEFMRDEAIFHHDSKPFVIGHYYRQNEDL